MRDVLSEAIAASARTNIEVIDVHWPPAPGVDAPSGDVSLVANVLYDNLELEAFLGALEAHTHRLCVVICSDRAPSTPDPELWEALHGEPLCALPGLPEFVAVLGALHRRYEVRAYGVPRPPAPVDIEAAMSESRWRYWVEAGSPKDERLRALLIERFSHPAGGVALPPRRNYSAVVSWEPPSGA